MPNYRRAYRPGGTFFFTLVTEDRAPLFAGERGRSILHDALENCLASRPFELVAVVLLLDHLHAMWTLPIDDADFSSRWSMIKSQFTRNWLADGGDERAISESRKKNRRRGVWQPRFYEHLIRDQDDFNRHLDYIHFNPVKHGLAACPHSWTHSSFGKWVRQGDYARDWGCSCNGRSQEALDFGWADEAGIE